MQKNEKGTSSQKDQVIWEAVDVEEAKKLPGYGFRGASLGVCVIAVIGILLDLVFIDLLDDRFYVSTAQLPLGSSQAPWVIRFFGLIDRFPPAFIAEGLIGLHLLLAVALIWSHVSI